MTRRHFARWLLATTAAVLIAAGGIVGYTLATASADVAVPSVVAPDARDISPNFTALWPSAGPDEALIDVAFTEAAPRLRETRIVIVPSWLSDGLLLTNRFGITDYFASQIATLRKAGFDVVMAPVDSEARVAENAAVLARLVAEDDSPVCFISHSKGGLDVLELIIKTDVIMRRKIACWLALQAPFYGSPIADLAAGSKPLRAVTDPLAELLGGSGGSLDDLTIARRTAYLAEHDETTRHIVGSIPILAVTTRIDHAAIDLPTIYMRPAFDWMAKHHIPNDGLVPVTSAALPGGRYIVIADVDHTDMVADGPIYDSPEQRLLLLKALLALTLAPD